MRLLKRLTLMLAIAAGIIYVSQTDKHQLLSILSSQPAPALLQPIHDLPESDPGAIQTDFLKSEMVEFQPGQDIYTENKNLTHEFEFTTAGKNFHINTIGEETQYETDFVLLGFGRKEEQKLNNDLLSVEYVNDENGLRQNLFLADKPAGENKLQVDILINTSFPFTGGNTGAVYFYEDSSSHPTYEFADLYVYDQNGTSLPAEMKFTQQAGNYYLSYEINDQNAVYPIVIDPVFRKIYPTIIQFTIGYNHFGEKIVKGDFNDDGYDDLVTTADNFDTGSGVGFARLYLGSKDGLDTVYDWAYNSPEGGGFGFAIDNAGDLNDDGYDDLIVSTPNFGEIWADQGKVWIFFGDPTGLQEEPVQTISPNYSAYFGNNVAGIGDVNGDDYDDVAIQSLLEEDYTPLWNGVVTVHYGGPSGISPTPAWTESGDAEYDYWGKKMLPMGDLNKDGFDDFVIASQNDEIDFTGEGLARLYFGSASGPVFSGWEKGGGFENALMAYGIVAPGDVNADGYNDLVINTYNYWYPEMWYTPYYNEQGIVKLYLGDSLGLSDTAFWQKEGSIAQNTWGFGNVMGAIGDINGNGYADILIAGGWTQGGDFWPQYDIYEGLSTGFKNNYSVRFHQTDDVVDVYGSNPNLGGDFDGDGFSDLVMSAVGEFKRNIFIFKGGYLTKPKYTTAQSTLLLPVVGTDQDYYSSAMMDGDFNNDGKVDLVVRSPNYVSLYNDTTNSIIKVYYSTGTGYSTTPSFTAYGHLNWNNSMTAGDLDGNGLDDLVINSHSGSKNGDLTDGFITIYWNDPVTHLTYANKSIIYSNTESIRNYINAREDLNNDGYDDFVLSKGYATVGGMSQAGKFEVYYGHASHTYSIDAPDKVFYGNRTTQRFGESASVSDLNNDGWKDLVISSSGSTVTGKTECGRLDVFYNSPAGFTVSADSIFGTATFEYLGLTVDARGDLNNDGYNDIVAYRKIKYSYAYTMYEPCLNIYYFNPETGHFPTSPSRTLSGSGELKSMSTVFWNSGDVNRDNYDDLLVISGGFIAEYGETAGAILCYWGSPVGITDLPAAFIKGNTTDDYGGVIEKLLAVVDYDADTNVEFVASNGQPTPESDRFYLFDQLKNNCGTIVTDSFSVVAEATKVHVYWNDFSNLNKYLVRWKYADDLEWTNDFTKVSEYSIIGLTACDTLQIQVQIMCNEGGGPWSDTLTAVTNGCESLCDSIYISAFTGTAVGETSVSLVWDDQPSVSEFIVRYKPVTGGTWLSSSTTSSSAIISSLSSCTPYLFYVDWVCYGDTSGSSDTIQITTICPPCSSAPTGLYAFAITNTSAKVGWNAVDGAIKYKVYYRKTGTVTWIKKTSSTLTKKLTGLFPGSEYQYKVMANCAASNSAFSPISTFTTTNDTGAGRIEVISPLIELPEGMQAPDYTIYPNPSSDQITIAADEEEGNDYIVYLVSLQGVILSETVVRGSAVEIDISSLPAGLYYALIRKNDVFVEKKFVKIN